ncbi:MAG: hypothetical protein RIS35_1025 [Pseudomonadota bacterium]|jgi:hypothetical protein
MDHPIVKTVATLVHGGDVDQAERALVSLADQEGDRALALVIDALPPRDVIAILREHDASKASVITELISPRQFVAAIALERNYRDKSGRHDALKGMINAAVFADEARGDEIIEALGADDAGLEALADYFTERHEEVEHFLRHGNFGIFEDEEFDEVLAAAGDLRDAELADEGRADIVARGEVEDADWRELAWRLRCDHFEVFRDVLERLRGRRRAALAAPRPGLGVDDDEEDEDDDGDDVL